MGTEAATPVPPPDSPFWEFYADLSAAQVAAWAPATTGLLLDLSGPGDRWARQLRNSGYDVLKVGGGCALAGVHRVIAEVTCLPWLIDASVDAVVAESNALSSVLATEETVREIARVLRPGGQLLLSVESLLTGMARLAHQGRWAELADVPASDCVLVPDDVGRLHRCFWPAELRDLLAAGGLVVDWVRPRSILNPGAVERALERGGAAARRALIRTELTLSRDREGESTGLHLVASARRPA